MRVENHKDNMSPCPGCADGFIAPDESLCKECEEFYLSKPTSYDAERGPANCDNISS